MLLTCTQHRPGVYVYKVGLNFTFALTDLGAGTGKGWFPLCIELELASGGSNLYFNVPNLQWRIGVVQVGILATTLCFAAPAPGMLTGKRAAILSLPDERLTLTVG